MQSAILLGLGMLGSGMPDYVLCEEPAGDRDGVPGRADLVTLFLTGDVMIGRGLDQVLPHPGDARLYEPHVRSALEYVSLAEAANGPIPRPVDFRYVWGDALAELDARRPDIRLINLETAVTTSVVPEPKGINYKMHPRNLPVLTAAEVDCCVLANNHAVDWGKAGLLETLRSLQDAGLSVAGAGRDFEEAATPAVLRIGSRARLLVFGFGSPTSGVPGSWAATQAAPGVNFLRDLSRGTLGRIARQVNAVRRPGDLLLASIHWGPNWGYEIPERQVDFARGLVDDAGFNVVHGHSSHHFKGIEVYRDRPILYGCGDFLNDYEGISGYESFRDDLVLMYFLTMRASDGRLEKLEMVPLQIRKFRLNRASSPDVAWVRGILNREGERYGTSVRLGADDALTLSWDRDVRPSK